MEYFELIEKRYSVRRFLDQDVPDSDLAKMIKAAGIAPSGKNYQNWHFVVIKNKEIINKMGDTIIDRIEGVSNRLPEDKAQNFRKFSKFATFFTGAPVLVAVYAGEYIPEGYVELVESKDDQVNIERLTDANPGIQGIGGAIEQMILAAFDLGYGACWMTSPNNSALELEKLIDFKKDKFKLVALVPIGKPDGERRSPAKMDLSDIMTLIK